MTDDGYEVRERLESLLNWAEKRSGPNSSQNDYHRHFGGRVLQLSTPVCCDYYLNPRALEGISGHFEYVTAQSSVRVPRRGMLLRDPRAPLAKLVGSGRSQLLQWIVGNRHQLATAVQLNESKPLAVPVAHLCRDRHLPLLVRPYFSART